jgi:hypothetical protein
MGSELTSACGDVQHIMSKAQGKRPAGTADKTISLAKTKVKSAEVSQSRAAKCRSASFAFGADVENHLAIPQASLIILIDSAFQTFGYV